MNDNDQFKAGVLQALLGIETAMKGLLPIMEQIHAELETTKGRLDAIERNTSHRMH